MERKLIILDGNSFSNLPGFYDEIERLFTKNLDWKLGHSLDAFNDILYGGFGVYEPNEAIEFVWQNMAKSRIDLGLEETVLWYEKKIESNFSGNADFFKAKLKELRDGGGQTLFETVIEIIAQHKNIAFKQKE